MVGDENLQLFQLQLVIRVTNLALWCIQIIFFSRRPRPRCDACPRPRPRPRPHPIISCDACHNLVERDAEKWR